MAASERPRKSPRSQPRKRPERTKASAATIRRATASNSAQVKSAVSAVSTSGVMVTTTPRARAAWRSMLSTPIAQLATMARFGAAASTAGPTRCTSSERMPSQSPTACATVSSLATPSGRTVTSAAAVSRASSGGGRSASTAIRGRGIGVEAAGVRAPGFRSRRWR